MPSPTYFFQECPTCGRMLRVRVDYLGKLLACRHCRGPFRATDPATHIGSPFSDSPLLKRADELLKIAARTV